MHVVRKLTSNAALATAVVAGLAFGSLPANALTFGVFEFSYSQTSVPLPGLLGSGSFIAQSLGGGQWQLDTISGSAYNASSSPSTEAITKLSSYADADNILYYPGVPQLVDFGGLSFTTAFEDYNIYWNGYYGILESSNNPVGYPNGVTIDFSVTEENLFDAPALTPLPGALALFAGGLGLLGFTGLAKRRKTRGLPLTVA
jgi:hypothetical protein